MSDQRDKFIKVYSLLKAQLLDDPAFEWDDTCRQWVEWMMDYNVLGGKLNRGFSVVDSYMLLKGTDELTDDDFIEASSLGWCIELFQAASLVLDDIMDNSQTRRGQPCYYRVPRVGLKAINDSQLLGNFVHRILRNQFKGKPYYADLLESLNEVQFQTVCGQMIDLITTLQGEKDLNIYNLDRHRRIVQYKTAYCSFYLPVASALLLSGESLDSHPDVKDVLIDMGIYFQVQDDFLDCYGDAALMGKIGSDIEDFKCSWLIVKALELCDEEQKKLLNENYGKKDSKCVERVKQVYRELNLEDVFDEYENETYEKLCNFIDAHHNEGVQKILRSFLGKIYRRQK